MDGPPPAAQAPVPPLANSRVYVSPTLPNPRELGLLGVLGAILTTALALPWILISLVNSNGLDFDTWKPLQAGAGPEWILPQGFNQIKNSDAGLIAIYEDTMWAMAKEYPDQRAAVEAWRARWSSGAWPQGVQGAATSVGGGQWLAFASLADGRMIEWVSGKHVLRFFGPDDSQLSRLIAASPMIDARGEPRYGVGTAPLGMRLLRFNAVPTALSLNALVLLGLAGIWWLGLRRYSAAPPAASRKLGREALRTRLLGLNTPNTPVVIEEQEPYHLICRWKVDDPELAPWLAGRNLREAWQLDIYLGDKATAGVLETTGTLSWDGRQVPPAASFQWSFMREVGRTKDAPASAGDPDGLFLPTQSISPEDFRAALRQLLLSSGWHWKPILFRPLVWEYR